MSPQVISKNEFGCVYLAPINENVDGVYIDHPSCQANISLHGGQVLSWQPKGQKPVLWLSDNALYQPDKAIRGGIPLCWPWFGPFEKERMPKAGLINPGNHGFARLVTWQVEAVNVAQESVTVTLQWQGINQDGCWPQACELKQELVFGADFKQTLFMTNLSNEEVEYTGALHSYFKVSSPQNTHTTKLDSFAYNDKLTGKHHAVDITADLNTDNKAEEIAEPLLNCVGPIDRIYYGNSAISLIDRHWQRAIEVTSFNTQQWVFWNPGKEIAVQMLDIHKKGENEFVCLEAANTQWQKIQPRSTVSIGQYIKISRLRSVD